MRTSSKPKRQRNACKGPGSGDPADADVHERRDTHSQKGEHMATPDSRHERRSQSEPYIEEATFYSNETDADGEPMRTYHVRRVDVGGGWSYEVSMEVIAKRAAEDILGKPKGSLADENTRAIWNDIWDTQK
jgi:hypothetical protein